MHGMLMRTVIPTYAWPRVVKVDLNDAIFITERKHFVHDFMFDLGLDMRRHRQTDGSGI